MPAATSYASGLTGVSRIRSRSKAKKSAARRQARRITHTRKRSPSGGGHVPRPAPVRSSPVVRSAPIRRAVRARPRPRPRPRPKPKPPPSLRQFLRNDADYQDQLRQFSRTWSDFLADVKRRQSRVNIDFETGQEQMGEQRVRDLESIEDDFAARGLLKSGLYGERVGDYQEDFQERLSELVQGRKRLLRDITTEKGQFDRELDLQRERSRKQAARRRASKYGI